MIWSSHCLNPQKLSPKRHIKSILNYKGFASRDLRRIKYSVRLSILDYIRRTEQSCMGIDNVFVIMGPHPREAHVASISWWAKILMNQAGLGDFSVRSARSSSSTCALMMEMPFTDIISHVGWTSEDTFIRKYLKP